MEVVGYSLEVGMGVLKILFEKRSGWIVCRLKGFVFWFRLVRE